MNHYIYTDYCVKKVIFECDAENILEADKQYETATDKNPEKQMHVGCQIIKNERMQRRRL